MTYAELAEKVGFSAKIITRLKNIDMFALEKIKKIKSVVLNCEVDEILEFITEDINSRRLYVNGEINRTQYCRFSEQLA